jgi:hypothetical protein
MEYIKRRLNASTAHGELQVCEGVLARQVLMKTREEMQSELFFSRPQSVTSKVRKMPSWPRGWANFSLL